MCSVNTPLFAHAGYVSVFTAHRISGYSCRMLCHLIETGELTAIRKGKRCWRIKLSDLYECLLRRMDEQKLRNRKVVDALLASETEENRDLTRPMSSTIYSTGPKAVLKGETYDAKQESTEVHA